MYNAQCIMHNYGKFKSVILEWSVSGMIESHGNKDGFIIEILSLLRNSRMTRSGWLSTRHSVCTACAVGRKTAFCLLGAMFRLAAALASVALRLRLKNLQGI